MPKYTYDLPKHDVDHGVEVKVADLLIDPQAQRTLNERRAQTIASNLVREAVGTIIVSERGDGSRYIVDGQHRKRASELAGLETIRADIHYGLTQEQEAILFLIKNRESHKPRPIDEYHVGLTGGVPLFVDTDRVLQAHQLSLGSSSTNSIGAVSGVLQITDRYGAAVLDRTLTIAEEAWGRSSDSWDGMLLGGIGMFLGRHGEVVNDSELAKKLERVGTAAKWRSQILSASSNGGFNNSGTGSRISVAYRLVLDSWNKGRRAANKIEG
ncbi:DUF6551 family protein [Streptomyces coelicoflavus]|uniref:DUF6551 family protein n=1 Tax=Streptomyces coelicoflavus TaxID=285562 RepID=UPI00365E2F73